MRLLLLVLIVCTAAWCQPYRTARVVDRDGSTNLREQPSLKGAVVATVPSGHLVLVLQPKGEFWDVLKLAPIEGLPDSFGYIHKSRLKFTQEDALGAGCIQDPDGWSNLRAAPSASARVLARLTANDWFLILKRGEFFRVRTARGLVGYLHQSRVEWLVPRN